MWRGAGGSKLPAMATTTTPITLLTPGDPSYELARMGFNLAADLRPAAIAQPESVEDVIAAVNYARENGLRIVPQNTGHNATPLGSVEDAVLIKMGGLRGAEVDVAARRARMLGGSRWGDLAPHIDGTGLTALHGSSPTVGVVGYSLGGGIGWQARRHGLQANSVTAVELVTAAGELVRADAHHNPDLFWALRGGGGNFGVVTAIEFALYPAGDFYAGWLVFPIERAAEVLHAWNALTPSLPDEITSLARIMRIPDIPEVPEHLRGQNIVIFEAAFAGAEADGQALLAPLRELGPMLDTFAMVPPAVLRDLHQDPQDPVPGMSTSMLLGDLPAEAIDALVAVAGPDSGSPFLMVELRHLGGALGHPAPGAGALPQLNGTYVLFAGGIPMDDAVVAALQAGAEQLKTTFAAYDRGRYLNFTETPIDSRLAYSQAAHARLQDVKAKWDPADLFRANHPIRQDA